MFQVHKLFNLCLPQLLRKEVIKEGTLKLTPHDRLNILTSTLLLLIVLDIYHILKMI